MPKKPGWPTAAPFVPRSSSLPTVARASKGCKGCHLYKFGTQTVFGEGMKNARVMFIGEQPGNSEDLAGKPFVGPAGQLLDEALVETGIDRKTVYVTNAVKHFKYELRGKRRLHKKPNAMEIAACHAWLDKEIQLIKPRVIICLGATAAQAMLGKDFRVMKDRGKFLPGPNDSTIMATVHPSSLLRMPDPAEKAKARKLFIADLKKAAKKIKGD